MADEDVDVYISPRMLAGNTPPAQIAREIAEKELQSNPSDKAEYDFAADSEVKDAEQGISRSKLEKILNQPSLLGEGEPAYFYDSNTGFSEKENGYQEPSPYRKCDLLYRILLNGVLAMLGLALLGLGCWVLIRSSTAFAAYLETESQFVRSVKVLSSLIMVTGIGLLCAGAVGIVQSFVHRHERRHRALFFIYEAFIFVSFMVAALLVCLGILALVSRSAGESTLGEEGWRVKLRDAPQQVCDYETRNSCAGYKLSQCTSDSGNGTLKTYCPGHFCVDFCGILSSIPRSVEQCRPCTVFGQRYDFGACKDWERQYSPMTGCKPFVQSEVSTLYAVTLGLSAAACAWIMLSTLVTGVRMCLRRRR